MYQFYNIQNKRDSMRQEIIIARCYNSIRTKNKFVFKQKINIKKKD